MVEVRIGLPLPMDIASTLLQVIGKTYPGTVIKQDADSKWRTDRQIILEIPEEERHNDPKAKKKYLKWRRDLQKWDSDVTALGPDGVSVAPFEWLAKQWVVMAQKAFELEPGAVNYLESQVYAPEGPYVFYVAKSDRQTPHELRKIAETQLAVLQANIATLQTHVATLTEALEEVDGSNNIRAARAIVKRTLSQEGEDH